MNYDTIYDFPISSVVKKILSCVCDPLSDRLVIFNFRANDLRHKTSIEFVYWWIALAVKKCRKVVATRQF